MLVLRLLYITIVYQISTPLKLITLDIPFAELKGYPQVVMAIHDKSRPERPSGKALERGLNDRLWTLLCSCWAERPSGRPSILDVRLDLERIAESK